MARQPQGRAGYALGVGIDRYTHEKFQRLRASRVPAPRPLDLRAEMGAIAKDLRRRMAGSGAGAAFIKLAPRELAAFTTVVGVRSGVLQLRPHNTAARYALDRWLRSGGERSLLSTAPGALVRVKLV